VPKKYFNSKSEVGTVDEDAVDQIKRDYFRGNEKERYEKDLIDIIGNAN
jgi:hypothetical protein